jgi:hypothetical protein
MDWFLEKIREFGYWGRRWGVRINGYPVCVVPNYRSTCYPELHLSVNKNQPPAVDFPLCYCGKRGQAPLWG